MAGPVAENCMIGQLRDPQLEQLAEEAATRRLSEQSINLWRTLKPAEVTDVTNRKDQLYACLSTGSPPHYAAPRSPSEARTVTTPDGRQKVIIDK